jgi:transposase
MDNATFHKREDIQTAIQQAGMTLEYLPPYSPDLNPIEHKWAEFALTMFTLTSMNSEAHETGIAVA